MLLLPSSAMQASHQGAPALPELSLLALRGLGQSLGSAVQAPAQQAEVDEQKSVLELGEKDPRDQLLETAVTETHTHTVLFKLSGKGGRSTDRQAEP